MTGTMSAQRAFFAERGYLPFGRVYSDREVGRLREALERIRANAVLAQSPEAATRPGAVASYHFFGEPGTMNLSLCNLHRLDGAFRRHAFHPRIAAAAAELLATGEVRLMMDQVNIKEPQTSGRFGWHQDFPYFEMEPACQVSCWLALDPVTRESGAMQFVPGSHRLGERAPVHRATGPKSTDDLRPEVPADPVAQGLEIVVVELAPGECVFHHSLTWHATEANTSHRTRRAVVTRFMARGTVLRTPPYGPRPDSPWSASEPQWSLERNDRYPVVWPQRSP